MPDFTSRAWRGLAPNEQNLIGTANYIWNTGTLQWEAASGSSGAGSVTVTNFPATQTVSVTGTVATTETYYITAIEEASSTVTYVGWAAPGTAAATAAWRILKLTDNGSGLVTPTMADGNSNFDNQWSNRASLSYS